MTAATPISIIPTLDTQSILTDPRDILAYILRYYAMAPKSVSNSTPALMISLADTVSRYQANADYLAEMVAQDLNGVYNRFFAPGTTTVDVSSTDNGDGSYNLTISLAVLQNTQTFMLGASVTVNQSGILNLKWHPAF